MRFSYFNNTLRLYSLRYSLAYRHNSYSIPSYSSRTLHCRRGGCTFSQTGPGITRATNERKTPRNTAHKRTLRFRNQREAAEVSVWQRALFKYHLISKAGSLRTVWLHVAGIGNSTRLLCEAGFVRTLVYLCHRCIFSQPSHLRAAYIFFSCAWQLSQRTLK